MSDVAKKAREAMKSKAKRLASGDPHAKVDASGWTPPEPLNTEAKTGLRPVSRRAYKAGGKVEGEDCAPRADRKKRKNGGRTAEDYANAKVNRNVKEANAEKFGKPHVGGMKKGGRAHKMDGGINLTDPRAAALARMQMAAGRAGVPASRMGFVKRAGVPLPGSGMKKGGTAKDTDISQDKKLIKKAMRQHEVAEHGGKHSELHLKKGGSAKKADGGSAIERLIARSKEGNPDPSKRYVRYGFGRAAADEPQVMSKDAQKQANAQREAYMTQKYNEYKAKKTARQQADDEAFQKARFMGSNYKKGGRTKRADGGPTAADLEEARGIIATPGGSQTDRDWANQVLRTKKKAKGGASVAEYIGSRPTGGRAARKDGGRAKGKTNINIVIAPSRGDGQMPGGLMPPSARPPVQPVAVPPPAGAPTAQAPVPMPVPMPMPGAPGMGPAGRKTGGRVGHRSYRSYKDMDAGAGSGLGRLEKIEIQENKR